MRAPRTLWKLTWDRHGSVAPLFGVLLFATLAAMAAALDLARAYRYYTHLTVSLDLAALATAKKLKLESPSDSDLRQWALQYFETNYRQLNSENAPYTGFDVSFDRAKSAVKLDVAGALPTTLARIFGIDWLNVRGTASAIYEAKSVELSMMLDVSGSMEGSKIDDLRGAARDLARILLLESDGGARNRIAIAPYSTSINVGNIAERTTGRALRHTCVTERGGPWAFTDERPGNSLLGRRSAWCPSAEVTPLTNDIDVLERRIDDLEADGATAGHLGIAWAWYLLSPNWAYLWPEPNRPKDYGDPETIKSVIIMTDGEFNTYFEATNGNSRTQSEKLCANIKAAGILVFAVAFQAPAAAEELLQRCASSPLHYFDAENGAALRAAFQEIARRLSGLRLTN